MICKPLLTASVAVAGLLSLSALTLATEQGSQSKPDTLHAQVGRVDLAHDQELLRPNSRTADKLIDMSERAKQEDVRYRASGA